MRCLCVCVYVCVCVHVYMCACLCVCMNRDKALERSRKALTDLNTRLDNKLVQESEVLKQVRTIMHAYASALLYDTRLHGQGQQEH